MMGKVNPTLSRGLPGQQWGWQSPTLDHRTRGLRTVEGCKVLRAPEWGAGAGLEGLGHQGPLSRRDDSEPPGPRDRRKPGGAGGGNASEKRKYAQCPLLCPRALR